MKNKSILLMGGAGFIGLHLAKKLSEPDEDVAKDITIFSKHASKAKRLDFADKIKFIDGDATNYNAVEQSIKNRDVIINLAAVVQDKSDFDPYLDLEVNCRAQINILEARKKVNPNSRYIFLGTRTQFGRVEAKDLPVSEELCQMPISLYGIHKQTAENYCKLYDRTFNLK